MTSIKATARLAGVLYFAFSLLAIVGYMVIPGRFVVAGNAAATALNIHDGETLYRAGILAALLGQLTFIALVLTLYDLFRDVDRRLARLMMALVCVGAGGEIVNLANRAAPLHLLSGAEYLSVWSRAELEALSLAFLRIGAQLGQLLTSIWGLWLFPFGILTIRSGYFPRVLGVLQLVSGAAYLLTCVMRLVFPGQYPAVAPFLMPLYVGEIGMVLWLLVMGAREPRAALQSEPAS